MAFIFKIHTAYLADPDFTFTSGIIGEELVNRTELAWLAYAIVVMSCKKHFVTKL